jgi:hypothetical protein
MFKKIFAQHELVNTLEVFLLIKTCKVYKVTDTVIAGQSLLSRQFYGLRKTSRKVLTRLSNFQIMNETKHNDPS